MVAVWTWILIVVLLQPLASNLGLSERWFKIATRSVTNAMIFVWFMADSKSEGHRPSGRFQFWTLALPWFLVPYYLWKVKGWRRALVGYAKCALIFASLVGLLAAYHGLTGWSP